MDETMTASERIYSSLLADMHRLVSEGQGDSEQAENLAGRMDASWNAMTAIEQSRMRSLAARLNAKQQAG